MSQSEGSLNLQQVQILVTALHEIARVDGVTPPEDLMIRQFYEDCRREGGALVDYDSLSKAAFDIEAAARAFNTPASRQMFIRTGVYLGYADGHFSKAERERLAVIAKGLGSIESELATIAEEVHDQLIGQFAHIQNLDALQQVSLETKPR